MLEIAGIVGVEGNDLAATRATASLLYTRISVIIVIVVIDDIVLVVLGVIISPLRFSAKSEPVLHTAQKTHSQCLAHMKQAPQVRGDARVP